MGINLAVVEKIYSIVARELARKMAITEYEKNISDGALGILGFQVLFEEAMSYKYLTQYLDTTNATDAIVDGIVNNLAEEAMKLYAERSE